MAKACKETCPFKGGEWGDGRTYLSRLLSTAVLFYSSTYMIPYTYLGKVKLVAARFEFTEGACITHGTEFLAEKASILRILLHV